MRVSEVGLGTMTETELPTMSDHAVLASQPTSMDLAPANRAASRQIAPRFLRALFRRDNFPRRLSSFQRSGLVMVSKPILRSESLL